MKHLPGNGGFFAASNQDIVIFHIERGQVYKEFTLKAESKTRELENLQKVIQERV